MLKKTLMLKTILIAACFILSKPYLYGQKNATTIYGTVAINSTSSMDATEVTINEWIYFIINNQFNSDLFPEPSHISNSARLLFEDLKTGQDFEYIEIMENSGKLRENYGRFGYKQTRKFSALVKLDSNYFSINSPIVGISFNQAQQFCKWREAVVNKTKAIKLTVSLPSIDVYRQVNVNKDSLCKAENHCTDCNGFQFNYSHPKCVSPDSKNKTIISNQGQCLLRADCYWPSTIGLYNIQGNAAEMTSVEGVAVGGSFRHFASQSYNDQIQRYESVEDWLGFRCLVTLQ